MAFLAGGRQIDMPTFERDVEGNSDWPQIRNRLDELRLGSESPKDRRH